MAVGLSDIQVWKEGNTCCVVVTLTPTLESLRSAPVTLREFHLMPDRSCRKEPRHERCREVTVLEKDFWNTDSNAQLLRKHDDDRRRSAAAAAEAGAELVVMRRRASVPFIFRPSSVSSTPGSSRPSHRPRLTLPTASDSGTTSSSRQSSSRASSNAGDRLAPSAGSAATGKEEWGAARRKPSKAQALPGMLPALLLKASNRRSPSRRAPSAKRKGRECGEGHAVFTRWRRWRRKTTSNVSGLHRHLGVAFGLAGRIFLHLLGMAEWIHLRIRGSAGNPRKWLRRIWCSWPSVE